MTLPTPSTSHISPDDAIYPPSEDSYLLLDALSLPSEAQFLACRFPPTSPSPLLVELGTGSGIVSAFLTAHASIIFSRKDVISVGIDVSVIANKATNTTIETACRDHHATAGMFCGSVTADLTSALRSKMVDILVFNPPYVPSEELPSLQPLHTDEQSDDYLLSLTYAGGAMGMEITDRLLKSLDEVLSDRGVLYLLLCKSNKPQEVAERVRSTGWVMDLVVERRAGWEVLSIWRISRCE